MIQVMKGEIGPDEPEPYGAAGNSYAKLVDIILDDPNTDI